ncbi:hypothetical protein [Terrabacter sp. NPDC080008]|uniref:hypothetical protein n=1 Tax=Terrabacter sp. NPDC080008 TaxID=3155176 RepID=UPI00344B91C1
MGKSTTRAAIIWFVGAAVVGAVAGGLHVLRSQIGGAHTGLALTVSAFGLTVLAAAMLFHGVMVAAGEQDAQAGPEPVAWDDEDDEYDEYDQDDRLAQDDQVVQRERAGDDDGVDAVDAMDAQPQEDEPQPAPVASPVDAQPERQDASARDGGTAYDLSSADEGQAVYTFRRGKPVRDDVRRAQRPPRRDRPA